MRQRFLLAALFAIGGASMGPGPARAETFNTCQGFITTLPATITTQGVWCLRHDLATGIGTGAAITIATNNVTIDCNDFKVGGLAAGNASAARGIYAQNRQNIGVRNCGVRGFYSGIVIDGGSGHLVEDNRVDNSLNWGIAVTGDNGIVERNRVFDTGGGAFWRSVGIYTTNADVIDNVVSGVFTVHGLDGGVTGIDASGAGVVIRGNNVRGLVDAGIGYGIYARMLGRIGDNHVVTSPALDGIAIYGNNEEQANTSHCSGNQTGGFSIALRACTDVGGNTNF